MELVTAQLSERVEHLMDIAELQAVADAASANAANVQAAAERNQKAETTPLTVHVVTPSAATGHISQSVLNDSIAKSLGEAAMLLNNVDPKLMRSLSEARRIGVQQAQMAQAREIAETAEHGARAVSAVRA